MRQFFLKKTSKNIANKILKATPNKGFYSKPFKHVIIDKFLPTQHNRSFYGLPNPIAFPNNNPRKSILLY